MFYLVLEFEFESPGSSALLFPFAVFQVSGLPRFFFAGRPVVRLDPFLSLSPYPSLDHRQECS